jgi:hypothetical protein
MSFFGCRAPQATKEDLVQTLGIRNAELTPRSAPNPRTPSVQWGPYVRQCQKCQKLRRPPSGTFGTPLVSAPGKIPALHNPSTHCARGTFFVLPLCTLRASRYQYFLIHSVDSSIVYV